MRPNHVLALNDFACILSEYEIDTEKALDYATEALRLTPEGSHQTSGILDTVGWAYYKHSRDLREAEKHLREALKTRSPYSEYHVTTLFHLLVVLTELGNYKEARDLFRILSASTPRTLLDNQNYVKAQAVMEQLEGRE